MKAIVQDEYGTSSLSPYFLGRDHRQAHNASALAPGHTVMPMSARSARLAHLAGVGYSAGDRLPPTSQPQDTGRPALKPPTCCRANEHLAQAARRRQRFPQRC